MSEQRVFRVTVRGRFHELTDRARLYLTGAQAGAQAARAGVARLVLTHVQPGHDPADRAAAAAHHFHGPIEVATIGATFDV